MYQDSTAVLGPLSRSSEPHAYDLCQEHAARMTAPLGWELLRVPGGEVVSDDLVALADAVTRPPAPRPAPSASTGPATSATQAGHGPDGRPLAPRRTARGDQTPARHLHVLRSPHE